MTLAEKSAAVTPNRRTATLDVQNLTVRYGAHDGAIVALSNVNFQMKNGDFVVAIGASGCCKTTLLSSLAGVLPPSERRILLDGHDVRGSCADRGVAFQKHALLPWLNVVDNVAFGLMLRGAPKHERYAIASKNLALVGLTRFERKMICECSDGMQQRVASLGRSHATPRHRSWMSRSARSTR